ncbi:hypothetical protein L1049_005371 [Liquidambar formosana]|uniref:Uncharacterized protein n=1 Tax=Liquidambar formosana TaxID=63359 RepID=A0AAP0RQH1_LIQFO
MVVFLLKIIFVALSTLSNLLSRLFFTLTAYLIVLFIHAFKVPGQAVQGALEQVGEFIKGCLEYLVEFIWEVITTIISTAFDLLKEGVFGSAAVTGTAIGGLVEKTRDSLAGLLKDLPEVFQGLSEMVSTVVSDLWNNYLEAVGYVKENA